MSKKIVITEEDILSAMQTLGTYIDITPEDFKKLYQIVLQKVKEKFLYEIKAKDIMNPEVLSVSPQEKLDEVIIQMAEKGVSGVPVVEGERVVGILSEKDILKGIGVSSPTGLLSAVAECLKRSECLLEGVLTKEVKDLMTTPAITVNLDEPVAKVIELFKKKGINRVPVVDNEGRLKGIIARGDLLSLPFFAEELL
ncbi:MAG: CBS domain-containing protein [Caldimicrobium sp.]